jgi:hypothetical protein
LLQNRLPYLLGVILPAWDLHPSLSSNKSQFFLLGIAHIPTAIIMNYNALKSAVEDTMKWEPNTVELSLYESLEHTTPQRFNLKEWMVPEKKIPPALKRMSPMMVSTYPHG